MLSKRRRTDESSEMRAQTTLLTVALGGLVLSHFLPGARAQQIAAPGTGNTTTLEPVDPPDSASSTSWQEECGGLVCQQNSTCRQGNTTFGVDSDVGFHTVTNQNGFYCECPDGFAGLDCGRPYQKCSENENGPKCYHGGICLTESQVEDSQYAAFCECAQAFYEGELYTGKYCEILVTESEYCPDKPDLFCVNGGSCPTGGADSLHAFCSCPEGFFGQHCEYVTPDKLECSLNCFNEGICRVGRSNAVWGNRDNFFCECPGGYGGVQCEHLAETCADGTVCLHGATCQPSGGTQSSTSYICACPDPYLGGSGCREQREMNLCMPTLGPEYSQSMAVPAFCLNGGTCRDVLNGNLVDFACDCPPLFEGPHCESLKTAEAIGDIDDLINPAGSGGTSSFLAGFIALASIGLIAIFLLAIRQMRRIRKSRRREDNVVLNLQSTREESFGAISANGSMLFPGISPPPSTFSESNGSNFTSGELMHEIDIT